MSNGKTWEIEQKSIGDIDRQGQDDPRISAIIPAYNAVEHLPRAIASTLAQVFAPAEIIVVDDGSTDGTFDVAASLGPPVRVVRQENAGAAAARNRGVSESLGDFVAFLDADDEWKPRHLANAVRAFEKHPDLQWYCDAFEVVALDGKTSVRGLHGPGDGGDGTFLQDSLLAQARSAFLSTNGVIVRRAALDEVGVFDTSLPTGEDRDLWFRLGLQYRTIGYCAEPGSIYHSRAGSLTSRLNLIRADRFVEVSLRQFALADQMGPREASRAATLLGRWAEEMMWVLYRSDRKADATYVRRRLAQVMRPRWRFIGWLYHITPRALWCLAGRLKRMLP